MYATSAWEMHCQATDAHGHSVMQKTGWAEQHRLMLQGDPQMRYYLHPPFLPRSMCQLVPTKGGVRLVDGQVAPYSTSTEGLLVWVRLMQLGLQRGVVQHEA